MPNPTFKEKVNFATGGVECALNSIIGNGENPSLVYIAEARAFFEQKKPHLSVEWYGTDKRFHWNTFSPAMRAAHRDKATMAEWQWAIIEYLSLRLLHAESSLAVERFDYCEIMRDFVENA